MKLHCTCGIWKFDMRTEDGVGWDAAKYMWGRMLRNTCITILYIYVPKVHDSMF